MTYFLFHETYNETGKYFIAKDEIERSAKLATNEWFSNIKDVENAKLKPVNNTSEQSIKIVKRGRPSGSTSTKNSK